MAVMTAMEGTELSPYMSTCSFHNPHLHVHSWHPRQRQLGKVMLQLGRHECVTETVAVDSVGADMAKLGILVS